MPGFSDLVQKAFYLGVGAAAYAAEKAGTTLGELRVQGQKLADEMVARGEITAEDARRLVDELIMRAQEPNSVQPSESAGPNEPRRIEILTEDAPSASQSAAPGSSVSPPQPSQDQAPATAAEDLRQQVARLQAELQRLKQQ